MARKGQIEWTDGGLFSLLLQTKHMYLPFTEGTSYWDIYISFVSGGKEKGRDWGLQTLPPVFATIIYQKRKKKGKSLEGVWTQIVDKVKGRKHRTLIITSITIFLCIRFPLVI